MARGGVFSFECQIYRPVVRQIDQGSGVNELDRIGFCDDQAATSPAEN
jgi:hypothetical protein